MEGAPSKPAAASVGPGTSTDVMQHLRCKRDGYHVVVT